MNVFLTRLQTFRRPSFQFRFSFSPSSRTAVSLMSSSNTDDVIASYVEGILRRLRILFFLGGLGLLLYLFQDIAQLFLFAALIAYLLNPLVSRLQRRTSRTKATILVFGLLVLGMAGGSVFLGPVVGQQIQEMQASVEPGQIEAVLERLDQQLSALSQRVGGDPVDLKGQMEQLTSGMGDRLVNLAPGLLGVATNIFLVPFLALFLLRDGPRIKRSLIRFVPNRYFEFALEALHKIDLQLGNYFRGLVLEISIVSVLSISALWLLDVGSFVLIGILAGITTVIPYAGSLLGGSVGVMMKLASTGSVSMAALVFLAFLAIQITDEAVIQPLVFARAVDLHPLEVLVAVWIAAQFFGVVGMVLAIPVTSAGKVVLTEGGALIQQYQFSSSRA